MKKMMILLGALGLVFVLGTGAYAATSDDAGFKQMLPFMKQMHPNVSDQQLEDMYNSCHGSAAGTSGMMNGNMARIMGNSSIVPQ